MLETQQPVATGVGAAPTTTWQRWRPSVVTGTATWASSLITLIIMTAVSWLPFQDLAAKAGPPAADTAGAFEAWHRWDTTWYLMIAEHGYTSDPNAPAFFPLYPMLVRAVSPFVPGTTIVAALVVSVLACLVAMILIHRLASEALGLDDGRRTVFFLLAFPTGFFLMAAYNESLFIALATASFYCMRKGRWWWAGAFAGAASATRVMGVLIGLAFVFEYLRQRGWSIRRIRFDVLAAALVPSGILLYMLYLRNTFGNALIFLEAQKSWGRSEPRWPWTGWVKIGEMLSTTPSYFSPDDIRNIVNLTTSVVTLILLVLALVGPWKLGKEQWYLVVFAFAVVLVPLTQPLDTYYPLASVWRYVLECTAAFMVVARMGRNPHVERAYLFLALALQGVMVISFVQNQFVA